MIISTMITIILIGNSHFLVRKTSIRLRNSHVSSFTLEIEKVVTYLRDSRGKMFWFLFIYLFAWVFAFDFPVFFLGLYLMSRISYHFKLGCGGDLNSSNKKRFDFYGRFSRVVNKRSWQLFSTFHIQSKTLFLSVTYWTE